MKKIFNVICLALAMFTGMAHAEECAPNDKAQEVLTNKGFVPIFTFTNGEQLFAILQNTETILLLELREGEMCVLVAGHILYQHPYVVHGNV